MNYENLKVTIIFSISIIFILTVFAVGKFKYRDIGTVSWYSQNKDDRSRKIKWCNNSVDRADEIECKNAFLSKKKEPK